MIKMPEMNVPLTRSDASRLSRKQMLCLLLLLLIPGCVFILRGPWRSIRSGIVFNDLLSPYIQSRAWIKGLDPYSPQTLRLLWPRQAGQFQFLDREVTEGSITVRRGIPTAYPVTSFVLLAPIALLSWPTANLLWTAINTVLFTLALASLVTIAGWSRSDWRIFLFLALSLVLAPFHTGIATGNPAIVTTELGIIAMGLASCRRDELAGLVLALAIGLKPQIGLCFLLYYGLRQRWRLCSVTSALVVAFVATGVLRLGLDGAWEQTYWTDNRALFSPGSLADFTERNPMRFSLINAQVLLYTLSGNSTVANIGAVLLGGGLFVVWLRHVRKCRQDSDLLCIGSLCVISLLPIYHRLYDGALLVIPLCWAISKVGGRVCTPAKVMLFLIIPFLLPGASMLEQMEDRGILPASLEHSTSWNAFVMSHQVWFLILMNVTLLYAMSRDSMLPVDGDLRIK
jgi:hypothetical protein